MNEWAIKELSRVEWTLCMLWCCGSENPLLPHLAAQLAALAGQWGSAGTVLPLITRRNHARRSIVFYKPWTQSARVRRLWRWRGSIWLDTVWQEVLFPWIPINIPLTISIGSVFSKKKKKMYSVLFADLAKLRRKSQRYCVQYGAKKPPSVLDIWLVGNKVCVLSRPLIGGKKHSMWSTVTCPTPLKNRKKITDLHKEKKRLVAGLRTSAPACLFSYRWSFDPCLHFSPWRCQVLCRGWC